MRQTFILAFATIGSVFAAPVSDLFGSGTSPSRKRDATSRTWAGAVQEGPAGTGWDFVQGSVVVPSFSGGSSDESVDIWVGIDGNDCSTAILQTGIVAYGDGTFWVWTEWWQYDMMDYSGDLPLQAGDQLRFTVHATSTTSGTTTIENLTNGQSVSHTFTSETAYPLCETDAEWIIEDWQQNGQPVPLINWGTIEFSDTTAKNSDSQVTANGSEIIDMKIDNAIVTSTEINSRGDVSVTYEG